MSGVIGWRFLALFFVVTFCITAVFCFLLKYLNLKELPVDKNDN